MSVSSGVHGRDVCEGHGCPEAGPAPGRGEWEGDEEDCTEDTTLGLGREGRGGVSRLCVRGRERKVEEKEKNWDLSFASSILRRKETFCGCFLTKPS